MFVFPLRKGDYILGNKKNNENQKEIVIRGNTRTVLANELKIASKDIKKINFDLCSDLIFYMKCFPKFTLSVFSF